jgi:hypothetical protein
MTPEESERKLRLVHGDAHHRRQNPSCAVCLLIQSLDRERELRQFAEAAVVAAATQQAQQP